MNFKLFYIKHVIGDIINFFITPDSNTWLFSSTNNDSFNHNSRYLFEYTLKWHPEINCKFVINDDRKRQELSNIYGEHFIETKTFRGITEALKAGVWLPSVGLPVYLFYSRRKRIILNLWHGTPLKKVGKLQNSQSFLWRLYFKYYFSKNITFISSSSTYLRPIFAQSFGIKEDCVKVIGQPRNDLLVTNSVDRLRWIHMVYANLPNFDKIILYAPTFRECDSIILFPFPDFNLKILEDFLEKERLILFIRVHQFEVSSINLDGCKRIKFLNRDVVEELSEVLNIFDLLITDYSSVFFDFLLTRKPELFLPYDLEKYEKSRGLNFIYRDITPGPKPATMEEFFIEITKLLFDPSYFLEQRIKMNDFFNEIKSDNSQRTVHFLLNQINFKK